MLFSNIYAILNYFFMFFFKYSHDRFNNINIIFGSCEIMWIN